MRTSRCGSPPHAGRMRQLLVMCIALLVLAFCITTARATTWLDTDIGAPTAAGSHTENAGVITVTGAGTGDGNTTDQLHYTYTAMPAGDIDMIVRLSGLTGTNTARAGIMLRSDLTAAATIAVAGFTDNTITNLAFDRARDANAPYPNEYNGAYTLGAVPIWLRLTRVGKDFAIYKSRDGKLWSAVTNRSGGAFTPTGAFDAGLFVASGSAGTTVTATFDNISIGAPSLAVHTSWIGNTFGGLDSAYYVSGTVGALHVNSDGTCYTTSYWDEAGQTCKIYKDGQVVKPFTGDAYGACASEGTVTSDGINLYHASRNYIYKTDLLAHGQNDPGSGAVWLNFNTNLWDGNNTITSGMAVVGNELFISDSPDNQIRVAATNGTRLWDGNNPCNRSTTATIDTTGVPNAAPMAVYQSQRYTNDYWYTLPGFTPNGTYTVRLHTAEYTETQAGVSMLGYGTSGTQMVYNWDLVVAGGGPLKALVVDVPNTVADSTGKITVSLGGCGSNHTGNLCGIEVLQGGTAIYKLNCGGGPLPGGWNSDVDEKTDRAFTFLRPGPMVADNRGKLWIIQEGNAHPLSLATTTAYTPAIKCFETNGTDTTIQITSAQVANPIALAYDAVNDRLLVCDNGPDQNIKIFTNLTTTPTLYGTFGVTGGIYTGPTPGRLYDAANGGWARFYNPNGVGIDSSGNIYVNCGGSGTDLRKYASDGTLLWKLNALHFVDCADFDPDSDGQEVYCPYKHYTMDYTQTAPGAEWTYKGYCWNPVQYGPADRGNASSAVVRRVGAARKLVMYTSGQGTAGYIGIFRFNGDVAVPCGKIWDNNGLNIWIDTNGDGIQTSNEVAVGPGSGFNTFAVDQQGDIWLPGYNVRRLRLTGVTANGTPQYDFVSGDDITYSTPSGYTGSLYRIGFDSAQDALYLMGQTASGMAIGRYDNWRTGSPSTRWQFTLPDPAVNDIFMNASSFDQKWNAFDITADKVFAAYIWGTVYAFDANTGTLEQVFNHGPEVSGGCAWEDENMGLRAFKRANGEYLVCTENSGYFAKNHLFRWNGPTVATPSSTPLPGTYSGVQAVTLTCATGSTTIRYTTDGSTPSRTAGTVYSTPVNITANTTLKFIAYTAGAESAVCTAVYNIEAGALTFTPAAGPYTSTQSVTITSSTGGATIRYTTDGSTPSQTTGTVYSTPVAVSSSCTLQAIAYKNGMADSDVISGVYTIGTAWPVYGKIEAENYANMNGVVPGPTGDTGGGQEVDWIDTGDWMDYIINVQATGSYTVNLRVASPNTGTQAQLLVGSTVLATVTLPNTGGYGNWQTVSTTVSLSAGLQVLRVAVPVGGWNLNWMDFPPPPAADPTFSPVPGTYTTAQTVTISSTTTGATIRYTTDGTIPSATVGTVYSAPVALSSAVVLKAIAYKSGLSDSTVTSGVYNIGAAVTIPGKVEAENYILMSGVVPGPTGDTGGGQEVDWIDTGDWMDYNVNVQTTGNYTVSYRVATIYTGTQVQLLSGSTVLATNTIPNTGGWDTWQTITTVVPLTAGVQTLRVYANAGGWNLNWIDFSAFVPCATPTFTPVAGTYGTAQTVTISTTTGGASIRYTTDGTTPSDTVGTVYSTPVSISVNTTLQAIAYNTGMANSTVASGVYTIQCAAPSFSPVAGTFTSSASVTISTTTGGASIRYTTDGTPPSSTVGTVYSTPVSITATSTLKAIAYKTGMADSPVTSGVYTIQCAAPTFNPVAGTYASAQSVTISTTTGGASIRYTTDGTTPSPTVGTVYSTPVSISTNTTLKAIAYNTGLQDSTVASGVYNIQCAAPAYTPTAGTYTTSTAVTITTTTTGASIRYTTDGTTPTSTVGTVYSAPVSITATCTLKAIAYKTGMADSPVTSGVYTIQCAAPTYNPAAGSYSTAKSVTITTTTSGASIRYTTDGTTPSSTVGTVYSSPVAISQTSTLKAIAYKTGLTNSTVTSGVYTIYIGYTTVGSTNTAITANTIRGTRFQAGSNMTIKNINLNIGTSVAGNIQCAIYTDNAGVPGTLLMGTSTLNNPGTGWKTFALTSSQALTSGTYYWMMCWSAANYSVKNTTTSGASWSSTLTYGTWPATAPSGTTETRTWSIYGF